MSSHLQHFTQCIYIPHSSTHTYTFLNWQAFQHFNLITLTTFYPVYMHSPQHYSMASLQHYEHFWTLWRNLQHITNNFKMNTLECIIHLTFLNNQIKPSSGVFVKYAGRLTIELMPQQIFISIRMFTKFNASLKWTFMDVHFNDPNSHFWMSLKITQTYIY